MFENMDINYLNQIFTKNTKRNKTTLSYILSFWWLWGCQLDGSTTVHSEACDFFLLLLFNDISTFAGNLNTKTILIE